MYKPAVEAINLELTTRCNARCPMCSRTDNPLIEDNPSEITLSKFKKYFPPDFISNLRLITFSGSFGDSSLARDCNEIHKYITDINPNITLVFHTNGGARNSSFWKELGQYYTAPNRYLVFHIDGLQDTNHIYRVDVVFDKVIENAKAAINIGAHVVWAMIVFAHNEHQLLSAQQLSQQLGFVEFSPILSARFKNEQPVVWMDKRKGTTTTYNESDEPLLRARTYQVPTKTPTCKSMMFKEINVDSRGIVMPCCHFGTKYERDPAMRRIIDPLSNPDLNTRSITDILEDPLFDNYIESSWKNPTPTTKICMSKCTGSADHIRIVRGSALSAEEIARHIIVS